MNTRTLFVGGLALSLLPNLMLADTVTMQASGRVTKVEPKVGGGDPPAGVSINSPVVLEWSYSSGASGTSLGSGTYQYRAGLDLQISVRIGGQEWAGTGSWAFVGNTSGLDYLSFEARDREGAVYSSFPAGGDYLNKIAFNIVDEVSPFTLLGSTALPTGPADMDLTAVTTGANAIGFITADNLIGTGWQIVFSINPLSVDFVVSPPPAMRLDAGGGSGLGLNVENLPDGQTAHVRGSSDMITFLPLDPPVDLDATTPQPIQLPTDADRLFFQIVDGPSPAP